METVAFISAKGGVGKSLLATNCAKILSENSKVLLIDGAFNFRALDIILGVENKVVYDIYDLANRKVDIKKALVKVEDWENLFLLLPPQNKVFSELDKESLKNIVKKLQLDFDYIVIDIPMEHESIKFWSELSSKTMIISTTDAISNRGIDRLLRHIKNSCNLIFNKVEDLESVNRTLSYFNHPLVNADYSLPVFIEVSGVNDYSIHGENMEYIRDLTGILKGEEVEQRKFLSKSEKNSLWSRLMGK